MHRFVFILLVCSAVAVAQKTTSPAASAPAQHPAATSQAPTKAAPAAAQAPTSPAANVPENAPVITIDGLCAASAKSAEAIPSEKPAGEAAQPTSAAEKTGGPSKPTPMTDGACKTTITRAQFEALVDGLNPQMPEQMKHRLAEFYPRALIAKNRVEQLGLDKQPNTKQLLDFLELQAYAQVLDHQFQEQAKDVPDSEIQKYYNDHPAEFEEATIERLMIPKSVPAGKEGAQPPTKEAAENLRARAIKGEPFESLQKSVTSADNEQVSPPVKLENIRRTALPPDQGEQVFALKPGEISGVIDTPSAFFIYKMDSKRSEPLDQAKNEIKSRIATQRYRQEQLDLLNAYKTVLNPAYFPTPQPLVPPPSLENGPTAPNGQPR